MAKMGAMQGAAMLLGPFGFGITAYEFIHKSGGDLARVSAIEQIAQERTEPIHKELVAALGDKDLAVRAAAAKALTDYHDKATQMAVYALLADTKQPVRLTAAAAYLRTTGMPGPPVTGGRCERKATRTLTTQAGHCDEVILRLMRCPAGVDRFRRIALSLPGAVESAHMGHPDFRVGGRIFATLSGQARGRGVLKLTAEQQAEFVRGAAGGV